MFSHDGKRYKVGSNYLKSLDLDSERNRIDADRRRGSKKGSRDDVIKNNRTGNRHKNGRRKRGRGGKKGKNRLRHLKHRTVCHPESNSCEEDNNRTVNNRDMVRSLDRRSSRKEREKRRRRKRGRKNRKMRKSKKKGGKSEEEWRRRKEERRQRRREKRRKRKERQRKRQKEQMEKLTKDISAMVSQRRQKRNLDNQPPSQCALTVRVGGGSLRLMDSCRFPHCNPSCPRMRNPEDGSEIGLLSMLEAYGMNRASMAAAMDVDVAALDHMDREVLLSKLNASGR